MKAKKLAKLVHDMYEILKDHRDESEATIVEEHEGLVSITEKFGKYEDKWFFNIVGNDIVFWERDDMKYKAKITCKDFKELAKIMMRIKKV